MRYYLRNGLFGLLAFLLFVGCSPARIKTNNKSLIIKKGEIYIKHTGRELDKLDAIFGYDNKDRHKVQNGTSVTLRVPVGKREFFVRSKFFHRNLGKEKLILDIKTNKTTCLEIIPKTIYSYPRKTLKQKIIPYFFQPAAFFFKEVRCKKS